MILSTQSPRLRRGPSLLLTMFLATGCSTPLVRDIPMLGPKDPHFEIKHMYAVQSPPFRRAVGYLLGPQILEGNRVTTLLNGDRIFPAMLEAIESAERSITFETYVYWAGEIGERFAEALSERASADDYFSSLGSTNFDNRSFQLNDEVNLNVFDETFSTEQSRIFDEDMKRPKLVTYEDWKQRPWYEKAMNWLAFPFRREL